MWYSRAGYLHHRNEADAPTTDGRRRLQLAGRLHRFVKLSKISKISQRFVGFGRLQSPDFDPWTYEATRIVHSLVATVPGGGVLAAKLPLDACWIW